MANPATPEIPVAPSSNSTPIKLTEMLRTEKAHVVALEDEAQPKRIVADNDLIGLALSGGGIRSATFSLGVIQALAENRWLRRLDYISTVSGGGYIGCWLSACIYRAKKANANAAAAAAEAITTTEELLAPKRRPETKEPTEIRFLRAYSSYLTPRLGLSGDTLAVTAGLARNLLLVMFLGATSIYFMISAIHVVFAIGFFIISNADQDAILAMPAIICGAFAIYSIYAISAGLTTQGLLKESHIPFTVEIAFIFGSVVFSINDQSLNAKMLGIIIITAFLVAGAFRAFRAFSAFNIAILFIVAFLLSCSVVMIVAYLKLLANHDHATAANIIVFGPAAIFLCFWIFYISLIAIAGNTYSEFTREWLGRLTGELGGVTAVWSIVTAAMLYTRPIWQFLEYSIEHVEIITPDRQYTVIALVVGITSASIICLNSHQKQTGRSSLNYIGILRAAGFLLVIAILFISIVIYQNSLISFAVNDGGQTNFDSFEWLFKQHVCQLSGSIKPIVVSAFVFSVLFYLGFRLIDLNTFSAQNLYRNRLVRCYLGAANHKNRDPNRYAGFDPTDDLELKVLANQRPYLLINAALNLTQGQDLAWQQRKAASFVFSPRWTGYWLESTETSSVAKPGQVRGGYVPTEHYASEPKFFDASDPNAERSKGIMVGTAMATSGAALSSQMGFSSRKLRAFLLTLLNIRLGRWMPNPAWQETEARKLWGMTSPKFGASYYLRELMGLTNEHSKWVYLSDGGHFENLAVYELVRRRCGRIICVDAGADPHRTFSDLGNMIQKCRVDFGVNIDIDTRDLEINEGSKFSKTSFATGVIHYPRTESSRSFSGIFLYMKPSITQSRDEISTDIISYAARHQTFPHEATSDQWFTETQFESYRQLGYLIALNAMQKSGFGS